MPSASQRYRSTRSRESQSKPFEYAVIRGLAEDGGLFVPSQIPHVPSDFIKQWANLSFQELAFKVMRLYVSREEIPDTDLAELISKSYSKFRSPEITPLVKIDSQQNLYLLELFHGPTYAFKDVALQFLGNLFEYFLLKKNSKKAAGVTHDRITVVGATSGDTGSAAIYGLRNKKDVSVFILYPTGRVSPLQEQQMTTVQDANIHTLSVKGTFDDCQSLVKQVFNDVKFNDKYHVGAVNSINWARILAQITYYYHGYFQLLRQVPEAQKSGLKVKFVVPSGNFGDILAGYYAKQMGLPVEQLVVATNENDILNRFLRTGTYDKAPVKVTYSPAMDICVSSNFERFLWYMVRDTVASKDDREAGSIMNQFMNELSSKGAFRVAEETLRLAQSFLLSGSVSNDETVRTIRSTYQNTSNHYILDPHSAVGISVAERIIAEDGEDTAINYISLSTAHPAKFSEVVNKALGDITGYSFEKDVLPHDLKKLATLPKKIKEIDIPELKVIEAAIEEELVTE
ncbi:threonine synthase [Brettanomyces nanus]|uniref:threonine synthase n=1 Tax=Eeniella nana TaxID=13502 RepID=A0A875S332_EENNA|nr:threonine synthase [Brettanomyces nanus]QPG74219.1 threonine synthase [Brettanomyces nanus]